MRQIHNLDARAGRVLALVQVAMSELTALALEVATASADRALPRDDAESLEYARSELMEANDALRIYALPPLAEARRGLACILATADEMKEV